MSPNEEVAQITLNFWTALWLQVNFFANFTNFINKLKWFLQAHHAGTSTLCYNKKLYHTFILWYICICYLVIFNSPSDGFSTIGSATSGSDFTSSVMICSFTSSTGSLLTSASATAGSGTTSGSLSWASTFSLSVCKKKCWSLSLYVETVNEAVITPVHDSSEINIWQLAQTLTSSENLYWETYLI